MELGAGLALCEPDRFGFWTYRRWRTRSTLAMVGSGMLNLVLAWVTVHDVYHETPGEQQLVPGGLRRFARGLDVLGEVHSVRI